MILNKLPNDVFVIASSILPIDEETRNRTGQNTRIDDLNTKIKSICRDYKNVHFVNPTKQLIDSENNLADPYHVGDGVHLNSRGYDVWISELRKALKKA